MKEKTMKKTEESATPAERRITDPLTLRFRHPQTKAMIDLKIPTPLTTEFRMKLDQLRGDDQSELFGWLLRNAQRIAAALTGYSDAELDANLAANDLSAFSVALIAQIGAEVIADDPFLPIKKWVLQAELARFLDANRPKTPSSTTGGSS